MFGASNPTAPRDFENGYVQNELDGILCVLCRLVWGVLAFCFVASGSFNFNKAQTHGRTRNGSWNNTAERHGKNELDICMLWFFWGVNLRRKWYSGKFLVVSHARGGAHINRISMGRGPLKNSIVLVAETPTITNSIQFHSMGTSLGWVWIWSENFVAVTCQGGLDRIREILDILDSWRCHPRGMFEQNEMVR